MKHHLFYIVTQHGTVYGMHQCLQAPLSLNALPCLHVAQDCHMAFGKPYMYLKVHAQPLVSKVHCNLQSRVTSHIGTG